MVGILSRGVRSHPAPCRVGCACLYRVRPAEIRCFRAQSWWAAATPKSAAKTIAITALFQESVKSMIAARGAQ